MLLIGQQWMLNIDLMLEADKLKIMLEKNNGNADNKMLKLNLGVQNVQIVEVEKITEIGHLHVLFFSLWLEKLVTIQIEMELLLFNLI